jgi:hypothetical protein
MIWIHKSITNKTEHYKYWSDRIIEMGCKINRGYLTVLGLYTPEEGKHELNDVFYDQLQNIFDKINKNDYILMMGDLNARTGNTKVMKIIGTNGEPTVNSNGRKLTDFCIYNNMRIMNSFFKHKNTHKFTWCA